MDNKNETKSDVAKREEKILAFWEQNNIFKKSEEKEAPKGEFVFYDGPPFATGLPHYGHILAGTIKDAIPRYKTMRGYRVIRRWGWDCHGLPLENQIEKQLGLKTKKDIEDIGVGVFNKTARDNVLKYADDWKKIVPRMGRWVHMDEDYKTMDASYTESVWWAFKTLFNKGLITEGFKSMHLCPRCGTTLSNFEVALGYKDIKDFSVTVKLELKDEPGTYILVWTTTPWTLPGNMAAALNKDTTYVKVDTGENGVVIIAKERLEIFGENNKIISEFKGSDLIGKSYIPPFDYYLNKDIKNKENAWKIYHASYVSTKEGTGIVHLAPAFGSDDMELAQEHNIPLVHHVDTDGQFVEEVKDFAGMQVKPKENHQATDIEIIKHLAHKGSLFKKEKITHSYPHCWRCETPLLNYASSSWFLTVPKIKNKLVKENKKVNWVPKDIRDGRFGKWLEGARDWAISRTRYWGAPLPVWKNEKTGETIVIGSVNDLKQFIEKSDNTYYIIRHGESELNTKGILNADVSKKNPLTQNGRNQVIEASKKLKEKKIDLVFHSPLQRTKETAEIIRKELSLSKNQFIQDNRLREIKFGVFEGKTIDKYHSFFEFTNEKLIKIPEGGESWENVKKRMAELLYEIESKYKNKNILIISHNGPLQMLQATAHCISKQQCSNKLEEDEFDVRNAEIREILFTPLPHNENYELDLHRPYIDDIVLKQGNVRLKRIPDVLDCWFESGSMPYGQFHYPFENLDIFNPKAGLFNKGKGYPADFIAEGLDQTRGWFYSLIVLGTALFGKSPYKNVIVNGFVLAEDGKKMSKSLNNYPDPMEVADKFGVDAIRYYLLSSPVVRGEDLNFSEKGVEEVMRKNVTRLSNVLTFYNLYKNECEHNSAPSKFNSLDSWILERLNELINSVTRGMEQYELDKAVRPIGLFIDDLSTWYIRRSRDRFKGSDLEDKKRTLSTTRFILIELSKIIAPFMPFFAEHLYLNVTGNLEEESVHLSKWPTGNKINGNILKNMQTARNIVSLGLEIRDSKNIKVRQPLTRLSIKDDSNILSKDILNIIGDEVNVKEVIYNNSTKEEVELDTKITSELKEEGNYRDFVRKVQSLRKEEKLQSHELVTLSVSANSAGQRFIKDHEESLKRITSLKKIEFKNDLADAEEFKIGKNSLKIKLKK